MRAFARKPDQPLQKASPKLSATRAAHATACTRHTPVNQTPPRTSQADSEEHAAASCGAAATHFVHNPGRIPLRASDSGVVRTKLAVNKPGDEYEQEADRLADSVMRTTGPTVQRSCACGGECPKCREGQPESGEPGAQTKRVRPGGAVETDAPPIVHEALRSPGWPLDSTTANFFAERFGRDFGRVRVHTDAAAARSADALGAMAYTVGRDLVFARGQYAPGTEGGRRLLAHELAHVVQQTGAGGVARGPLVQRTCLSASECGQVAGTAAATHAEVAQEEQSKREEISQRTVEEARDAVNGKRAVEAEKLLAQQFPNLRLIHGVFIDEGAVSTHVGARITDCEDWANEPSNVLDDERKKQFMGAKNRCVFITQEYEEEVGKYNGGSDKPDGRDTRAGWLVEFRRRFTHEATHERFVENQNAGQKREVNFPQSQSAEDPDCALAFSVNSSGRDAEPTGFGKEVSELAAEISEYTELSRADDPQSGGRLNRWFREHLTPEGESIPGTIKAIRCACSCDHANEYIHGAFKIATKDWTETEKLAFHRKMFELQDEFDLYWPFKLPPREGEVGRHGFSFGLGGNIAGTDRLLSAMLTYRYVLGQWASGRLRLTTGAQVVGRADPDFDKITGGEAHFEAGGLLGFQYIPEAKATEKRFGGFTARAEGGLGYGQFLLKPALPGGPAATVGSGDYILQVGAGIQFYIRGVTDLQPASLELAFRMAKPMDDDAEAVHTLGINFTLYR